MIHSIGIDEASIALLADRFDNKVRIDSLLGAWFNPVVHDWTEHNRLHTSFWASVILRASSYRW